MRVLPSGEEILCWGVELHSLTGDEQLELANPPNWFGNSCFCTAKKLFRYKNVLAYHGGPIRVFISSKLSNFTVGDAGSSKVVNPLIQLCPSQHTFIAFSSLFSVSQQLIQWGWGVGVRAQWREGVCNSAGGLLALNSREQRVSQRPPGEPLIKINKFKTESLAFIS